MNRERSGERDLAFSAWHRGRFDDSAVGLDIDFCGMCPCRTPLYLLETTRGAAKATSWTEAIAARLGVPAFAVYYTTTPEQLCITCKRPAPVELLTLQAFQVYPQPRHCVGDADAFAAVLLQLRAEHNVRAHDRRAG